MRYIGPACFLVLGVLGAATNDGFWRVVGVVTALLAVGSLIYADSARRGDNGHARLAALVLVAVLLAPLVACAEPRPVSQPPILIDSITPPNYPGALCWAGLAVGVAGAIGTVMSPPAAGVAAYFTYGSMAGGAALSAQECGLLADTMTTITVTWSCDGVHTWDVTYHRIYDIVVTLEQSQCSITGGGGGGGGGGSGGGW